MRFSIAQIQSVGGFPVVYADPAWRYSNAGGNGAAENHYPTLSVEEIAALPVASIAARDSVLFLWATNPLLPEALTVMKAWGFEFKTVAFEWVKFYEKSGKPFFGMGQWTRGNVEACLLGVRGKPKAQARDVSQLIIEEHEILTAPVNRHSEKPAAAREKIERLTGAALKVELFARQRAPGWDCWGNEVDSTIDLR